jgi:hypothetical protein
LSTSSTLFVGPVRPRRRPRVSPKIKVKPQGCRPSCHFCVDVLRDGCVVDDLCAQMWTSAFESTVFLAGFGNLPVQGRFCQNFLTNSDVFVVLQSRTCRRGLGAPRLRPPTRLCAATLGINNHLSSLYLSILDHVTESGVSRPNGICGCWYADQCISATVSLSDCPCFLDIPQMRRWISFHVLLSSELEFRQHLPVVLRIHTLPKLGRVFLQQCGMNWSMLGKRGY